MIKKKLDFSLTRGHLFCTFIELNSYDASILYYFIRKCDYNTGVEQKTTIFQLI